MRGQPVVDAQEGGFAIDTSFCKSKMAPKESVSKLGESVNLIRISATQFLTRLQTGTSCNVLHLSKIQSRNSYCCNVRAQ